MGIHLLRLGRTAARHPVRMVLLWIVLALAVLGARSSWGGETTNSFDVPGAESQEAVDLIEDRFPGLTGTTSRIVFHRDDGRLDDPAPRQLVGTTLDRVRSLDTVGAVSEPTFSADGRTGFATIDYAVRFDKLTSTDLDDLRAAWSAAEAGGLQVEVGGAVADFGDQRTGGNEGFGLLAAVVVLVIALGSVTAMILPIGLALFALLVAGGLVGLLAGVVDVPDDTTTLATMVGLGVGIDYALFLLTRYRELVGGGMARVDAIARANATAGQAVVVAGATVVVAIAGLQASGLPAIAMMGYGTAIAVALSVIAAVTLLPALLALTGSRIDGLLARTRRRRLATARSAATDSSLARRWAHRVGLHPARYAVASLAVLLALAVPATSLRIGFSDAGVESTDRTARRAYDLLAEGFGPGFNGPLLVVADLRNVSDRVAAVDALTTTLGTSDGVATVGQPVLSAGGDAAIVTAVPVSTPQAPETSQLIQDLRGRLVPAIEERTGATVVIGGATATFEDISEKLEQRLPWFIGAVVLLSLVLLVAMFRSVLVPLKAAVMNLLSIGAAYGIVVAVFQWGWGASLLGIDHTVPVNPFVPMMMFAILFGLSMDYEVFLLSRIREEYLRSGDSHDSVVRGLGATARVITSAALIMIVVFGAFVANPATFVKMIGVGLGAAVLLDATLIRMVLVPSTMALMGRANWWLPGWLDRLLPHVEAGSDASPDHADPDGPAPTTMRPAA